MSYRKRMITEREQRILDRVAARERKEREAAARREAERKANGYRTLTIVVPGELHSALSLGIKEFLRKWIAAHRRAEVVRPTEVDPLTAALREAIANIDVAEFGPSGSDGATEDEA